MKALIGCAVAVAVAGCAAAAPGYMPPRAEGKSASPLTAVKPFQSGSVDANNRYTVSDAERKLPCGKISGSMHIIMSRLKDAPNRPHESTASHATKMMSAPAAASSPPADIPSELLREKARLHAYNALLAEKKCPPVDISAFK